MTGYLTYEAWHEHLADLHRAAVRDQRSAHAHRQRAARPAATGLRRLRRAFAN